MPAFLDQIVAATRGRVAAAKREADLRELERRAERHVPRGFRRALESKSRDGIAIIAELKKASPRNFFRGRSEICGRLRRR
jgi:indole-3-glycerol phosphate synthase